MFDRLRGSRVLVTGASSGIGASIATNFGKFGGVVGVHYHSGNKRAEAVAAGIEQHGGHAHLLEADLTDRNETEHLVESFIDKAGGIDVLVNNAGAIHDPSQFLDLDLDSWEATLALDLTAPFILGREAFRFMMHNGGGRLITISSYAAQYGGSESRVHYGAAKAGLEAVTQSFSRFGARYNILANTIRPGVVDTPARGKMGEPSLAERVARIPLGRAGRPDEVAMVCIFLASEYGDYITGQTIGVTGGDH
jgi:NAD(P)-dependent dehydrogenase (short-subunit alcohol dehydrogenase family)